MSDLRPSSRSASWWLVISTSQQPCCVLLFYSLYSKYLAWLGDCSIFLIKVRYRPMSVVLQRIFMRFTPHMKPGSLPVVQCTTLVQTDPTNIYIERRKIWYRYLWSQEDESFVMPAFISSATSRSGWGAQTWMRLHGGLEVEPLLLWVERSCLRWLWHPPPGLV